MISLPAATTIPAHTSDPLSGALPRMRKAWWPLPSSQSSVPSFDDSK
jgi:hypothetical protein